MILNWNIDKRKLVFGNLGSDRVSVIDGDSDVRELHSV